MIRKIPSIEEIVAQLGNEIAKLEGVMAELENSLTALRGLQQEHWVLVDELWRKREKAW